MDCKMVYTLLLVVANLLGIVKGQNQRYLSSYSYYAHPANRYGLYTSVHQNQQDLVASSIEENDWSQWTEWSLCSRTCGGGVSMRTRRCGLRSLDDVLQECSGDDVQHRICNTQYCPDDTDFRSFQCSQFDQRPVFSSSQFKWTVYYGADVDPCQLACMAEGFNFYKEFGPVQDGTRCFRDKHDICIEGNCLKVGCDKVVGSNLTEDACGVCGGDNSGCYYYSSLFTQLPRNAASFDYHEVVSIPAGATRIRVKDESNNYLALMELEGSAADYVINGDWVVSWPGDVIAAGTVVRYSRTGNLETIEAPGPTTRELHVMMLYLDGDVSVEYDYWAPSGVGANQYSEFRAAEITREQEEPNPDYYDDNVYQGWDVLEAREKTTTITPTATVATTTTTETTTTTSTAVISQQHKAISSKKKSSRPAYCKPCKKPGSKMKHFCLSDFVIHARVLSKNKLEGKRYRHDITVLSVFKSDFTLMKREYLWIYSNCCPKLRPYRDYLIMGRKRRVRIGDNGRGVFQPSHNTTLSNARGSRFETRLVVDYMDYWRLWKKKYEVGMNRFSRKVKCNSHNSTQPLSHKRDPEHVPSKRASRNK